MSKAKKLLSRLLSRPKDFTFDELITMLGHFGYFEVRSGKTGGSRVAFANDEQDYIRLHKPHPRKIMKPYQINNLILDLKERGLL